MDSKKPPMKESDEATREQLDMAKEQGRALEQALRHYDWRSGFGWAREIGRAISGGVCHRES